MESLPISMVNTATRKIHPARDGGSRIATILQTHQENNRVAEILAYGQKKGAGPMTLEVASQTMRTRVAVRTVQQRMNVFHIRVDLKAGLRGSKYEEILLLLLLASVCIVKKTLQNSETFEIVSMTYMTVGCRDFTRTLHLEKYSGSSELLRRGQCSNYLCPLIDFRSADLQMPL